MFGRGAGDTYIVFIASLENDFGWSRSQLTSVYSVYLLVGGCVAPVVGLLFDRIGPRLADVEEFDHVLPEMRHELFAEVGVADAIAVGAGDHHRE